MNVRDEIVAAVIKEVVGPDPQPKYKDETTGEEILLASVHGSPKSRYGAGMLYPQQAINLGVVDSDGLEDVVDEDQAGSVEGELRKDDKKGYNSGEEQDEEPVGMANQYLPFAMGFTVRFRNQIGRAHV